MTVEAKSSRPSEPAEFERKARHLPTAIIALVVIGVGIYFGFSFFSRSVVYYRTPTEVLASPGEHVRLSGTVLPGSIRVDQSAGVVAFTATDGRTEMPVEFHGPAPDTLKDKAQAVAEGELDRDGVFQAKTLFAKCPSKFASKPTPGG